MSNQQQYGDGATRPVTFTRDALRAAIERAIHQTPQFRPTTITGDMAIAYLYLSETLSGGIQIICGPKRYEEIKRLQGMTLTERIAEREAKRREP